MDLAWISRCLGPVGPGMDLVWTWLGLGMVLVLVSRPSDMVCQVQAAVLFCCTHQAVAVSCNHVVAARAAA